MPEAHETHDHAHAAQAAPGPPCQCEQQFGNTLPLLLVAFAVVMALDRWMARSSRRSDGGSAALSVLDNLAKSPHTCPTFSEACMVVKDDNVFRRQARVLKALANESRLQIVDRLSRGECSVGELTDLVGSDRSTVSKHLAVLRAHGIVNDRRDGNVGNPGACPPDFHRETSLLDRLID
jgi:DNA-binding transcriptional ArsR family regulator